MLHGSRPVSLFSARGSICTYYGAPFVMLEERGGQFTVHYPWLAADMLVLLGVLSATGYTLKRLLRPPGEPIQFSLKTLFGVTAMVAGAFGAMRIMPWLMARDVWGMILAGPLWIGVVSTVYVVVWLGVVWPLRGLTGLGR